MSYQWTPITDPVDLKFLGKLGEETAELSKVCFSSIIQGIDGIDPHGGKVNRQALLEEIADVLCNIRLVQERFLPDPADALVIRARIDSKYTKLREWHEAAGQ